jgi:hypothetical protein
MLNIKVYFIVPFYGLKAKNRLRAFLIDFQKYKPVVNP